MASGELLIHYGSPAVTAANTVLVPVKTGATGGFAVEARSGATGALIYSLASDYTLPPHHWTPPYGIVLSTRPNTAESGRETRLRVPGRGARRAKGRRTLVLSGRGRDGLLPRRGRFGNGPGRPDRFLRQCRVCRKPSGFQQQGTDFDAADCGQPRQHLLRFRGSGNESGESHQRNCTHLERWLRNLDEARKRSRAETARSFRGH